jgi:hypothetical protein
MEHEVAVDRIGGGIVISCKALDFYNLELMGKVNEEDIKKTILRQKVINADDDRANFTVKIIDNRPESEENFNEKRRRESLQNKPKNRF